MADFGDFEDDNAEAEAELQREIERKLAERQAAAGAAKAAAKAAAEGVGPDSIAAGSSPGAEAGFAAFGEPPSNGFAAFGEPPSNGEDGEQDRAFARFDFPSSSGMGGDESAALEAELEAELEGARRERERVERELAADHFLSSLTHAEDPKAGERLAASGDGASEATDDIGDAYSSFEAKQLEARDKSFDAISTTVTDDEFNDLFGPVQ